jgi:hypothetical protein
MGRVVLHSVPDPERTERERALAFLALPLEVKLKRLFALIDLSVKLNDGKPLKEPQGNGIVIRKPKNAEKSGMENI